MSLVYTVAIKNARGLLGRLGASLFQALAQPPVVGENKGRVREETGED